MWLSLESILTTEGVSAFRGNTNHVLYCQQTISHNQNFTVPKIQFHKQVLSL
eukprot:UN15620